MLRSLAWERWHPAGLPPEMARAPAPKAWLKEHKGFQRHDVLVHGAETTKLQGA